MQKSVFTGSMHIWKGKTKPFVAPEEAAYNLINRNNFQALVWAIWLLFISDTLKI